MTTLKRTKKTVYQALATCCAKPVNKRPSMERIVLRKGVLWATDGCVAAWAPAPSYIGHLPDESAFDASGYIGTAEAVMPDVSRVVPVTDAMAWAHLCESEAKTLKVACKVLKGVTRGQSFVHLDTQERCARAATIWVRVEVPLRWQGGVCPTVTLDAAKLLNLLSMPAFAQGCMIELRDKHTPVAVLRPTAGEYQGWGALLATKEAQP